MRSQLASSTALAAFSKTCCLRAGLLIAGYLFAISAAAAAPASVAITGATGLSDTCNSPGSPNVFADTTIVNGIFPNAHDNFQITAPGFAGYFGPSEQTPVSGNYPTYNVFGPINWGINVPAGTTITLTIFTYSSAVLSSPIYSAAISWNCTTGAIISMTNTDLTSAAPQPVPTLSEWGMLVLAGLLSAFGFVGMRRGRG